MSCSSSIFIASTSHVERQPFRSSAVTTSTLECSASKCSLRASSPPGEDTTTALGTAVVGEGEEGEGWEMERGRMERGKERKGGWYILQCAPCHCAALSSLLLRLVVCRGLTLSHNERGSPRLVLISGCCQELLDWKHLVPRRRTPAEGRGIRWLALNKGPVRTGISHQQPTLS